jgi:hypothetical protein
MKNGAGLELWVSCGRLLLFSDQRLSRWFLRRLHRRGYKRGGFIQLLGGASPSFPKVVHGEVFFSCQASWAAGFGVKSCVGWIYFRRRGVGLSKMGE